MNSLTYDELKEVFDGEKNLTDKPIFIKFFTTWCGPCKMYEQVLNEVTPEYSGKVNLYEVDIEREPEMASLFGVMSVPTTTTISKGGDVLSQPGVLNEDTLKYFLEGLLSKK